MKRLKQYIAGTAAAIMLLSTSYMQVQAIDETVLETIPETQIEESVNETEETEEMLSGEEPDVEESQVATETETKEKLIESVEETEEEMDASSDSVEAFVARLYKVILNRNPDSSGLKAWTDVLKSGKEQGAKVAQGFVDSDELKNRNLSDDAYIRALYKAFFDREADESGLAAWKKVLNSGLSRMHVFRGFAESDEFTKICSRYGIIRGFADLEAPMDQNEGITKFIYRCYEVFLGRKSDEKGLNEWCERLLSGQISAKDAAYGFVMSVEFQNKGMSDSDYIKTLYRGLFDRTADSDGLSQWKAILDRGCSRESIFYGFADSDEFRKLAAGFGLDNSWQSTPVFYRSKEEIKEKVIEHYYYALLVSSDSNGCYAISDTDTQETSSEYRFILRYQMSDEKAWELINSGRFPNANELVGRVTVHKATGKVTLDSLNDTWWLW